MEKPALADQYQMNLFGYSPTNSGVNRIASFSSSSTYLSNRIQNVGHSCDVPFTTEHRNPQRRPSLPSNSQIISFQNSDLSPNMSQQYPDTYELPDVDGMKMKRSCGGTLSRTTLHPQENAIAERKRREKLSQHFTALSAIIPGLTKVDKASILGDTIKYLKQLEERVKILEEEVATRTVESASFVKKPLLQCGSIVPFSSEEQPYDPIINQQLPEIEARVLGKNVLIKVQCEKHEGCIKEVMKQIEGINLTILNISVLPFGSSLLDVTIVCQRENENCPKIEEIVEKLGHALITFIR